MRRREVINSKGCWFESSWRSLGPGRRTWAGVVQEDSKGVERREEERDPERVGEA